jgi:hypothetical protein
MKERLKVRLLCFLFDCMKRLFSDHGHAINLSIHDIKLESLDKRAWEIKEYYTSWSRKKPFESTMFDISVWTLEEEDNG